MALGETADRRHSAGERNNLVADMVEDMHARFRVGQLIQHKLFHYRGVIVDADPEYSNSEAWYAQMAKSRPPKDKPGYHVLVHDGDHVTYVAERNLEADGSAAPVDHPLVDHFFTGFEDGHYLTRRAVN